MHVGKDRNAACLLAAAAASLRTANLTSRCIQSHTFVLVRNEQPAHPRVGAPCTHLGLLTLRHPKDRHAPVASHGSERLTRTGHFLGAAGPPTTSS